MMTETWFTSDTHFGHKNILEYEKDARPFDTVEEMNERLIANWNDTVRPKDIVFHLGDFAFGAVNVAIADRLNGHKRLVMGNHDCHSFDLYVRHFQRLFGAHYWKRCILTHIPVHPRNLGDRFFLNVHGHLHSKCVETFKLTRKEIEQMWRDPESVSRTPATSKEDLNYFNVSVERHKLRPVHSSIIMERIKELDQ
jgi:calcineurin-like phosphoesterase family protein